MIFLFLKKKKKKEKFTKKIHFLQKDKRCSKILPKSIHTCRNTWIFSISESLLTLPLCISSFTLHRERTAFALQKLYYVPISSLRDHAIPFSAIRTPSRRIKSLIVYNPSSSRLSSFFILPSPRCYIFVSKVR